MVSRPLICQSRASGLPAQAGGGPRLWSAPSGDDDGQSAGSRAIDKDRPWPRGAENWHGGRQSMYSVGAAGGSTEDGVGRARAS